MESDVEEGRAPDVLGVIPRFFARRSPPIWQKIVHKIKAAHTMHKCTMHKTRGSFSFRLYLCGWEKLEDVKIMAF